MATATKAPATNKAPATATVVVTSSNKLVNPGEQATVGKFTVQNRGTLPVQISEGSKGGYRFCIDSVPVTQVMRHCGGAGWKFDEMRAVLSLLGLGEAVNDNTVCCQLSSGRRSAEGVSNPHHGAIPVLGKTLTAEMELMRTATAEVSAKGRELRRSGTVVAETGKGKNKVEVTFNWRNTLATNFVHSESGSIKRKAKKADKKKAK